MILHYYIYTYTGISVPKPLKVDYKLRYNFILVLVISCNSIVDIIINKLFIYHNIILVNNCIVKYFNRIISHVGRT